MAEVEVTHEGGVQTITLNRPEVLNAFNHTLHARLYEALVRAGEDDVRAVVITGAGRGFCAGQDINAFGAPGQSDVAADLRKNFHPPVLAIRGLGKPVIAAVNGACAGAGLSLACACDLRVAAETAVFVPAFVGIGLVPDSGATLFVTQLIGMARAFEWLTSNRCLSAPEALAWGLVSEVAGPDGAVRRAAEIASAYAALPTLAIGATKRLLAAANTATLKEQLEREAETQGLLARSEDHREGVTAFRQKRAPGFRGR